MLTKMLPDHQPSLLIFGYGSLIWNPGFEFYDSRKAYAIGFARRMYQGNTFHRGNLKQPGRVATIIPVVDEVTSGIVFRVVGKKQIKNALDHLVEREIENGYKFVTLPVEYTENGQQVVALTCIAEQKNEYFLGPASISVMAKQIATARGKAGPNYEYVLKLAEHVRKLFPEDNDNHLFELETRLRQAIPVMAA
ncbi:hypothetical protein WR25_12642 [Diploscapter pachys]|uniref:glutathione-specific gamma-glutamylcyclotransferase n=1 Tax=Diploscapter pachys TaxID=2018661 RepID=A0A2A2L2Y7_9BILA|nr:hypothetical protein WR25_12642 [Diploscapter pachys]